MTADDSLRKELIWALNGGNAHVDFETAINDIPKAYYGAEVPEIPYTLWRILQHMQISQRDIIEYIQNPDYKERSWPEDYWPKEKAPKKATAWKACVEEFRKDVKELTAILKHPKTELTKPIPHIPKGPTLLREILLVIDHNSYHIGQIILLRGLLGIWED
jgi:uncharacterized damage-inducible protein DinB